MHRFEPDRLVLVEFKPGQMKDSGEAGEVQSVELSPAFEAIGGFRAGADMGGSFSGGSGVGSGMGTLIGGGIGLAGAVVLMLPLGVCLAIDRAVADQRRNLDPGDSEVFRVQVKGVDLGSGAQYAFLMNEALGLEPGSLQPLPLGAARLPHLGFDEPERLNIVVMSRMGGGPVLVPDQESGALGGINLFVGRQFDRFAIGASLGLGALPLGMELRYDLGGTDWLSVVPFAGYGYYWLVGGYAPGVSHGPWAGLEVNFLVGDSRILDWTAPGAYLGLYTVAGPVFMPDRVGTQLQFGITMGLY